MTIREAIQQASATKSSADSWIGFFCGLEALVAIIAIPFTAGLSLFALLAVAPTAALGACATNTRRAAELSKVHLHMLADLHYH